RKQSTSPGKQMLYLYINTEASALKVHTLFTEAASSDKCKVSLPRHVVRAVQGLTASARRSSSARCPSQAPSSAMATGLGVAAKAVLLVLAPVVISVALYSPKDFSPAELPPEHSFGPDVSAPRHDARVLAASERIGEGLLPGPEDLAYDAAGGWLYTGCADGWVRRVSVPGGDVEDWAYTGGRPLGVVLAGDGGLVVADADKGLLKVRPDKTVEMLTDAAEGLKFALTDGVDIAADGTIYFTDASYKYSLADHFLDVLEARPHGRLMSFDPSTRRTSVLARDLYFANGVAVAPDQDSLIFCETVMRRCSRYHIRGDKAGTVESFIDSLPGLPDNIRYNGEGRYWIALSAVRTILQPKIFALPPHISWNLHGKTNQIALPAMRACVQGRTLQLDVLMWSPLVRKLVYMVGKYVMAVPQGLRDSGTMSVALNGEPATMYTDPGLALATGWLKVGGYLYYGSLASSYISRVDLTKSSIEA
uniref:Strictosidine synthase conserved region domain-containing protein n=4 Tax=Aegilops tauschii subsp. strangulata TaxID=200361 RepID=A0A452YSK0_AEGTS